MAERARRLGRSSRHLRPHYEQYHLPQDHRLTPSHRDKRRDLAQELEVRRGRPDAPVFPALGLIEKSEDDRAERLDRPKKRVQGSQMLHPSNLYHAFIAAQEAERKAESDAGIEEPLPRIRFHDLRHSNATILLQANVHPKVVAERPGHSSIRLTMDTYSHVIPSMQTKQRPSPET